jgi:hypothetical protein
LAQQEADPSDEATEVVAGGSEDGVISVAELAALGVAERGCNGDSRESPNSFARKSAPQHQFPANQLTAIPEISIATQFGIIHGRLGRENKASRLHFEIELD